jgi:Holliday junction resolvase RusA-like endonuclease
MKSIKIVIEGDPIAKARCRINLENKHFYNTQVHEKVATQIYMQKALAEHKITGFFTGPCFAEMIFYIPIGKYSKHKEGDYCLTKPVIDNLCRWFYNCGNGILYHNDKIIVMESSRKIYSHNPRTIMIIKELDAKKKKKADTV